MAKLINYFGKFYMLLENLSSTKMAKVQQINLFMWSHWWTPMIF